MSKRSKSSRRWLDEHFGDEYVRRARREGWRSRAVFKLEELDAKDRLFNPGMRIIDLGAAPGGWSQYAAGKVAPGGQVIAMDLLPMAPLDGVECVRGDFTEDAGLQALRKQLAGRRADLVMSDMAPNISGVSAVDQPRAMYLAELVLELAPEVLNPGGSLLIKLFQGEGFDEFVKTVRRQFARTVIRKPRSSRSRSREVYLVARNYSV